MEISKTTFLLTSLILGAAHVQAMNTTADGENVQRRRAAATSKLKSSTSKRWMSSKEYEEFLLRIRPCREATTWEFIPTYQLSPLNTPKNSVAKTPPVTHSLRHEKKELTHTVPLASPCDVEGEEMQKGDVKEYSITQTPPVTHSLRHEEEELTPTVPLASPCDVEGEEMQKGGVKEYFLNILSSFFGMWGKWWASPKKHF